ncbi:hypothetical protein [Erythrobacter sp. JK5]|uniref:hypothetical protein n=1 Tax=Erythrobacter sp. JK5 TaxID=2829500 RepID=UPI001BA8A6C8|nr:hypothetical protein [Erythrobacter sp. JK5]QUL37954.1 hypothetical protein KDC96_00510 [Erythrobacter sp. JK5]
MTHGPPGTWDRVVIVPTYARNTAFLRDCLASLAGYRAVPILLVVTAASRESVAAATAIADEFPGTVARIETLEADTSELGGLHVACRCTSAREMFLLHDSCEVLDHGLFRIAFDELCGSAVPMLRSYGLVWTSCLGKYRRATLDRIDPALLLPGGRLEAMEAEITFTQAYSRAEPQLVDFPEPMRETDEIVARHGRDNHLMANSYLRKWKASWSIDHVFRSAQQGARDPARMQSETRMSHAILEEFFGKPKD